MSHRQIKDAITTVANELFGRKQFGEWKMFGEKVNTLTDNNTLPAASNLRRTEKYMKAMALRIVDDIMEEGAGTSVVYSNDGSVLSGVGSYDVHSIHYKRYKT